MIDADSVAEYIKIGAFVGALAYAAFRGRGWVQKKSAEDRASIASDDARVDMLKRALDEADRQRGRADTAFDQRNVAVSKLGALEAQVQSLERHKVDCEARIAVLEQRVTYLQDVVDRRLSPRE